jgi:hypothetical protein
MRMLLRQYSFQVETEGRGRLEHAEHPRLLEVQLFQPRNSLVARHNSAAYDNAVLAWRQQRAAA